MKPSHTSRRSFLAGSAAALTTAAFSRPLILSGSQPSSSQANSRINLALVGCGGQGRGVMRGLLSSGANLVALCDPDEEMIDKARADALKSGGEATKDAKAYEDYRQLLDNAASFDAVLIGTPDHWHAPLCKAFMKAGKHVYCEKPLTHSVAEARELRELSHSSNVVTQMGNQGSASESLRRCTEVIRAGALGQIREIYQWGIGVTANEGRPEGEDPVPRASTGICGSDRRRCARSRKRSIIPSVAKLVRLRQRRPGRLLLSRDQSAHAGARPGLSREDRRQHAGRQADRRQGRGRVPLSRPRRIWRPSLCTGREAASRPEVLQPLTDVYGDKVPDGLLIVGEKGCIYTSHWNTGGLIRLQGEARLTDVLRHEATKDIPETLPRNTNHGREWLDACRGQGQTFSDFDIGGKLTEIGLAGVVGIRAGQNLDWDGEKMEATNAPEAARFVHTDYRTKWLT